MKLSGLTILRNGITCGYTFIETIKTLEAICDEVIVCEGYSTDNTYDILQQIQSPKIQIFRDRWNIGSDGAEFARITNLGMERCTGDYIFYLQADEIVHEDSLPRIKELVDSNNHHSITFNFAHLRYDFTLKIANDVYDKAIRVVRNIRSIRSHYDAYTFEGDIHPGIDPGIAVYHAGYVFLENILEKMINHAEQYYIKNDTYQARAVIARKLLERIKNGENVNIHTAHEQLEPYYTLIEHHLPIPALFQKHLGKNAYKV